MSSYNPQLLPPKGPSLASPTGSARSNPHVQSQQQQQQQQPTRDSTGSSPQPQFLQQQYPYSADAADLDLSWILAASSPGATTSPNAGYDPLSPSTFHAVAAAQHPAPASAFDPDIFEQDLEQAFNLDTLDFDTSAFHQLELELSQQQAQPAYANNISATTGGYAAPNSLYAGSYHSGTSGHNVHTAFSLPRSQGPLSTFSNHDNESSVYSETSAYQLQQASHAHSVLFAQPPSPTYQSLDLPGELDLARFSVLPSNPSMPDPPSRSVAPRSAYAASNVSSVAPSSLAGLPPASEPVDPDRKHPCPHCPRAFARAYNLKTHIATHDPQRPKPYRCPYQSCGRGFSRKHDLGRHVGSVHEKGEKSERGVGERSERGGSGDTAANGDGVDRVWCDGCGRGWVKGMKAGCVCDEKDLESGKVKWEDNK